MTITELLSVQFIDIERLYHTPTQDIVHVFCLRYHIANYITNGMSVEDKSLSYIINNKCKA